MANRRTALAAIGTSALAIGAMQTRIALAADGPRASADNFLATLEPAAAQAARFDFGGNTHRGWNFMGTGIKPGLLLERMSAEQKAAADTLLRRLLSEAGYAKMRLVMATQDVMRALGRGPADRNAERFAIAVFGTPGPDLWGVRIEGHHLSLSWTLSGDRIVGITPASFSVIPQHIPVGKLRGTTVLEREEGWGRRLIRDLTGRRRAHALFAERSPGNVQAMAGREDRFAAKQGIAAADLADAQRDLLWELIETTTVEPWPTPIAEQQRARIRAGDPQAAHFAWAGGLEPGEMFYYRIHGDTFVLEFASVFRDPEHLHAVYHDPPRTLGRHMM
ncbi:MAG: DUF3500 domain-containing protein [Pseudomonadota bacterium]